MPKHRPELGGWRSAEGGALLKWYPGQLAYQFTVGKTETQSLRYRFSTGPTSGPRTTARVRVSKLRAQRRSALGTFTVGGQPNFVVLTEPTYG